MITEAHALGLRVMIDAVFNHCGAKCALWQDVLEKGPQSDYYHWFCVNRWPIDEQTHATKQGDYFSFAFVDNMPKFDTSEPDVMEYLTGIAKHWVCEWKVDGIRFDVGNEISHAFLKHLRLELKKCNPKLFLLGEIWHDAFPWLLGDESVSYTHLDVYKRQTLRNIHENLFWAFFYNIIGIPLAAGVWIPLFGWQLNPMFGAAAMSLSSFCVVTNALRLNLFRMYDAGKDRRIKNAVTGQTAAAAAKEPDDALEKKSETNQKKENETMKKTMKINGMMCGHCEARVKKALEAVEGVQEAVVSHESGNAVVTLTSDVADEVLKKAVEDQDYEVVSVES